MADLLSPQFRDEKKARSYLENLRWKNGVICPHCGVVDNHYKLGGAAGTKGLWKCRECRNKFTVTVGTVFASSRIPLHKWLLAVHLMCSSKKAISAHQIHRMLGITYKTAWFMCHRIREAMKSDATHLLGSGGGTVEADETFWGNKGKQRKGARSYHHQMKIVSLVDRTGEKRSFKIDQVSSETLRPLFDQHVCKSATLNTDELRTYIPIGKEFNNHDVVVHSKKEYVRKKAHTNTVECSFSLLKRGLIGTYHHVGEQHLERYITEFDYRWNKRKIGDKERSEALLEMVGGKRLMYGRT